MRYRHAFTAITLVALLLAIAGPARAGSVYQGHVLAGSPLVFLADACEDPSLEGLSSNCVVLAPTDAGLPIVGFAPLAPTPCIYTYGLRFYDADGAFLSSAVVGDHVPLGAAKVAVFFGMATCVDFDWELAIGFE